MDQPIKKSQTLYSLLGLGILGICIVLCYVGLKIESFLFYQILIVLCFILMIVHLLYVSQLKKSFLCLIDMTQNIIEQKDKNVQPIDGESYISVLSSQLYFLDKRMKGMIEKLQQEQNHLKEYIEDISHQLKTPITSLILKEDILLEEVNLEQRDIVEQLIFQTQRISSCVESLLQLAQIESHSITYHYQLYLFDSLCESIQDHLQPLLESNDVSLKVQGENNQIYCDFQWMSEALENIVKNCIEQKQHAYVDMICEDSKSFHKIVIRDYGEGIRQEDIHHIFDRFYQSQYQRKHHGIGIGLAITKGVVDDHHGTIHAYNDDGAVFEIILPKKNTKSKYTVTNQQE